MSLASSLNIGVRHLLPVFPFTYILVSGIIIYFLDSGRGFTLKMPKYLILAVFILWQVFSVLKVFPYFISYGNELAGGPKNLYLSTVDSNYDWGQDLKRLVNWTDKEKINRIYVDYFGGADTKYYLNDKLRPWQGDRDSRELPKGSYLAVSATFLQGGRGEPVPGFSQPHSYYDWLNNYTPIKRIGYSIFVYQIQ